MVGRSNVGKSSLINALVKQKIARTSAAPGKTRLVNYYLIESRTPHQQSLYLVDLPGYGYARGGARLGRGLRTADSGLLRSVHARRSVEWPAPCSSSIRCHPDLPQDAAGYAWLLAVQAPLAIVATKIDKLNRSEQASTMRTLKKHYDSPVLPVSAFKGDGLDRTSGRRFADGPRHDGLPHCRRCPPA